MGRRLHQSGATANSWYIVALFIFMVNVVLDATAVYATYPPTPEETAKAEADAETASKQAGQEKAVPAKAQARTAERYRRDL